MRMRNMRGRNTSVCIWSIAGARLVLDRVFWRGAHMISHCSFLFSLTKGYNDTNRLCSRPDTRVICYCGTSFGWDQLVFHLFADFGP
jgi:hypothetical protein